LATWTRVERTENRSGFNNSTALNYNLSLNVLVGGIPKFFLSTFSSVLKTCLSKQCRLCMNSADRHSWRVADTTKKWEWMFPSWFVSRNTSLQ
jgi:hypothetical protein